MSSEFHKNADDCVKKLKEMKGVFENINIREVLKKKREFLESLKKLEASFREYKPEKCIWSDGVCCKFGDEMCEFCESYSCMMLTKTFIERVN